MLSRSGLAIAAAVAVCLAAPAIARAETERSGYASVNGLSMYCETRGTAGRWFGHPRHHARFASGPPPG
jgi:hypothetical protein